MASIFGKDATRPADRPLGEHVLMRLMEPIFDKQEVPYSVKYTHDPSHTTILLKSNDMVLTSYQGKVTKNVLFLSTLLTGIDVDQQTEKKIPETIKFYMAHNM
ncbi:hypothetical protein PR048_013471 [Dryococelus australis]|uniref:Uncharacterized protein n=1 Tax=Dryococelus australis TaxID=614101 RepID=A0ABQ9HT45_9NEOP|nr:hypothetical protein PR048_013471 [Dryococelus australis]